MVVKETGQVCQALFVPDGYRWNQSKLQTLTDRWKETMPGPYTMISCDAGTVHPKQFGSPVLWTKLSAVFAAILDAAAVAHNWIVIDRTSAKLPASDLLIEAALMQTRSRPPILVIDSQARLKSFRGPSGKGELVEATASCCAKLKAIKACGVIFGTDEACGCATINQFYNVDDFVDPNNPKFLEGDMPCPAEPAHLRPDGTVSQRVKWQYHYLATLLSGGTHYIVLENVRCTRLEAVATSS